MTIILNQTALQDTNAPPIEKTLDSILHQLQSSRRSEWVITTWTHRGVVAMECLKEPDDTETWVSDAVQGVTKDAIRQFVVATNIAPQITIGFAFDVRGGAISDALMFGEHMLLVNIDEDLVGVFNESAKAFWGPAWEPVQ